MKIQHHELSEPGPGEVMVAVAAIGLNFADVFAIWGLYGATPTGVFTPGLEFAGQVVRTGSGVTDFSTGDQVYGVTRFGAYTTGINIDQRYIRKLPPAWDIAHGAAFPVQALTAYYGLKELGNTQPGQTVLIHSAAGGVGLYAGRIANRWGCYTIGTVGSARKATFLQEQEGYDAVIVRDRRRFAADLASALNGKPLNVIMDSIGGTYFTDGFAALAPMGRHVVYGSARYASVGNRPNYLRLLYYYLTRPKLDPQKLPEQNKGVLGFNLIWLYDRAELMGQLLAEIHAMELPPPHIGHTFSFERLPEAIRLFQSGQTIGKVIVRVD